MKEQLIVALTSWRKRICNVPAVLDSIFAQTVQPDAIVLTLAEEEFPNKEIPSVVQEYIDNHEKLQLNWVKHDTKVWKKFLLSFRLYPDALFMNIDDDKLYPPFIIESLLRLHRKYPDSPISGNKYWRAGVKCHAGELSLVQPKHFVGWEKFYKHSFRITCQSSDMFYTRLAASNGYFYIDPDIDYVKVCTKYNEVASYTASIPKNRLVMSDLACYQKLGYEVVRCFTEDDDKPYCVFGSAQTEQGKLIEKEMLEWLIPHYNVFVVRHDGTKYEYPAISFLQKVMSRLDAPCLYIHTKGAYYKRGITKPVRNMWKYEFTAHQSEYFNSIKSSKPVVACPYTGYTNVTWYNGWVANPAAIKQMEIAVTDDRYYYEHGLFSGIKVKGLRMNNIVHENRNVMHRDLKENFA